MGIYKVYLKRYRALFVTAITCVLMEALCDLMQPTLMAHIIDDGIRDGRADVIFRLGLVMLLITALGCCFAAARSILASRVSQSFGADLREDLFQKILRFSEQSADKIESGSLITRMTNDTSQITQFINGIMRIFVKAPVMCLGSIALAVMLSPRLSLVVLSVVGVVTVLIAVSMRLSYIRFARVQAAVDRVNSAVQEYLLGIRLVKAFGRYADETKKFDAENAVLSGRSEASQRVVNYFSPLLSLTVNLGIAVLLYWGSLLFSRGQIQVGKISAFLTYMAQILSSLIMITNVFNVFVRTKASTVRIREILDSGEDFADFGEGVPSGPCSLEFRNVTFAYPGGSGVPALFDLSFKAEPGETLAVIGPTGSGKSTLAWLCLRFYDPDKGSVTVGGRDLKTFGIRALRGLVSVAPQKSMLFTGSVFDNIAWGAPGAGREEIAAAARAAQADAFVQSMPQRYDSMLGQGGVNLSGGQKQRISIARALARKSPVLILDDCTSALDSVTEARVRRGIAELTGSAGATVLLITQRIGTAMTADRILVLDNGSCVGYGSHQELMVSCRVYREIYDSQIGEETKQVR